MVILKIAFRNLFLNRLKTTVVGIIIVFGTFLAILGNSFVDAISSGMQRSLTASISGDIQIYSKDSKDKLSLFGNMDGSPSDIGRVLDFQKVNSSLMEKIPNIETIVPMGSNFAMINPGNLLDKKLTELRELYLKRQTLHHEERLKIQAEIEVLKDHVRRIVCDVNENYRVRKNEMALMSEEDSKSAPENLARATSETFWKDFEKDPEEAIEFLGNKIALLIFDDQMLYLSYVGVSPSHFKKAFPLFEIVKGTDIPEGKRGFLFNDSIYESMVKNRVARRLDRIKDDIIKEKKTIAKDKVQKDRVNANVEQAAEIYSQIAPQKVPALLVKLQKYLNSSESDFQVLVKAFLQVNDESFMERYKFFYDEIAPHIVLYRVAIGDVFPINAFTKTGYSSSLNMKVYGTFKFKSFESSSIAGNFNIIDLISFRDLYGFQTEEKRKETEELEKEMGISDLSALSSTTDVESMFSKSKALEKESKSKKIDFKISGKEDFEEKRNIFEKTYSDAEMENGVFLNAAVVLKDPKKIKETMSEIAKVSEESGLGIQVLDWRDASGMVGQLTIVVRTILYILIFVIFIVAAFIIMNSMLMATMDRKKEIGTMRAIGAQRSFLMKLFFYETFILSFIFGAIGTLLGVLVVWWIGKVGIPASGDVATFFFSGPRLYLNVNPLDLIIVFVCITLVAILSTQYPALRAMRISPLEAMQNQE